MGAYLSEPKVDKESTDESNEFLSVGASSMQGWRSSQEDAHNSILSFDKNTSFFAVYDGHGGAEVATYTADELPKFLKQLDAYKNGDFETALEKAFLGFDATLLEDDVIEVLKGLAGEKNVELEGSEIPDDDDVEDLAELREEGILPLDAVLEKYKFGFGSSAPFNANKVCDGPSGSKPQSPLLRSRRQRQESDKLACGSAKVKGSEQEIDSSRMDTDDDSTVSSSSNQANDTTEKGQTITSNGSGEPCSPDSSLVKDSVQNGDVSTCRATAGSVSSSGYVSNDDKASGSSAKSRNGELPSPSGICIAATTSSGKSAALYRAAKGIGGITSTEPDDDTSSESDADFQAEENSSTDDDGRAAGCGSDDDEDDDEEVEEYEEEENEDEDEELENRRFCATMIEEPGKDSGCTAVVALLHGRDLYVANAGDSRCVVCRNGKAIDMSIDHKPEDEAESLRIIRAGGRITLGRVNGGLNLSRAIGDHAYKGNPILSPEDQMISAFPDIKKIILDKDDEFMILACDGIWNFLSSEEVVQFVRQKLEDKSKKVSKICEELFHKCLAPNTIGDGTGCDNMTAVIVCFKDTILDLPTKLKYEETEPAILEKQAAIASDDSQKQSLKRSVSPTSAEESVDGHDKPAKRFKTDETLVESEMSNECDSRTSSSTSSISTPPTPTTSVASTTSATSTT